VTAAWRLGGQAVTIAGAAAAGTMTGLLGNRPQPVLAAAGGLTLLITAAAWAAGLRRQDAASVTAAMRGN
jgi:hypothetical protein